MPTAVEAFLDYDLLYFQENGCGREPPINAAIQQQVQPSAWTQLDYHRLSGYGQVRRKRYGNRLHTH